MSNLRIFFLLLPLSLVSPPTIGNEQPDDPGRTGVIATSGDVMIQEIRIERVKASFAAKEADLTYMLVKLWLTSDIDQPRAEPRYLVRLDDLAPVVDDTGRVLSTERRLAQIKALHGEVLADEYEAFRGKSGPVIGIVLEAPARGANRIKSLKGMVAVAESDREIIRFDSLRSLDGKFLDDKRLKGLRIKPTLEADGENTTVTLKIEGEHERLTAWEVVDQEQPLSPLSVSRSASRKEQGKTYPAQLSKTCSLWLAVAVEGKKRVVDFDFKDLDLP